MSVNACTCSLVYCCVSLCVRERGGGSLTARVFAKGIRVASSDFLDGTTQAVAADF